MQHLKEDIGGLVNEMYSLTENLYNYGDKAEYRDKVLGIISMLEIKNKALTDFFSTDPTIKRKTVIDSSVNLDYVKEVIERKKRAVAESDVNYTLYKTNKLAKIANRFFEKITLNLVKKYPEAFSTLKNSLKQSDLPILSNSYISVLLLFTVIGALVGFLASLLLINMFVVLRIINSILIGIIAGVAVFFLLYLYPSFIVNSRKKKIKSDLPFVILHMAAIAGSGAQPIAMFNLVLGSEEYPGLKNEIKKIVNYVNLFGYDLPTALKAVSNTTPSKAFKELLNGIVTVIESGGSIKDYLQAKSDEALVTYKLERKKYVETLATYSDVYTGLLIAAPLLFFVTIAIIQIIGGEIAGLSATTIASIGTFVVIPLLNIGFLVFLNLTQEEL
ncbi:type II secretion system F family protein [Candidatus Woesearchaeota archaeon]|nr:type II secretion system F family protein [Candidatus Woesearchaeota archaeon]